MWGNQKKKQKSKISKISIFGFQCVAKKYRRMVKYFVLSMLVYSQIWLNLPRDNSHFFLPLPMDDDAHFSLH